MSAFAVCTMSSSTHCLFTLLLEIVNCKEAETLDAVSFNATSAIVEPYKTADDRKVGNWFKNTFYITFHVI